MPRLRTIIVLLAVLWTSHASTQELPPKQRAEGHYQTAVKLFGEGRYAEALAEFDQAIAISPESIFYCNRAVVLIELDEAAEALESLETCQRTHSGSAEELAAIDAQRAAVSVITSHVQPGALGTVSLINAPIVAPAEPASRGWTRVETGILLMGIGGAAFASAATLDFLSKDLKDDLRIASEARVDGGADYAQRQREYDEARIAYRNRQRVWIGLTAGGALFTLTGATFAISRWLSSNPDDQVEVGITLERPGLFVRKRW